MESRSEGTLNGGDGADRRGGALKVAVIGAGIVGSSVAHRLSEGGAEVFLIDGAEPGSGTTSTSFAWVNANNKLPRDYFELNVAGMDEHERLRDEIGGDWLYTTGNLIWAAAEEQETSKNASNAYAPGPTPPRFFPLPRSARSSNRKPRSPTRISRSHTFPKNPGPMLRL